MSNGFGAYYLDVEKLVVGISNPTSRTFDEIEWNKKDNMTEKGNDDDNDNEM